MILEQMKSIINIYLIFEHQEQTQHQKVEQKEEYWPQPEEH